MTDFVDVPGAGNLARRALADHAHPAFESVDGADYHCGLALHGVGERGLERYLAAPVERGLSIAGKIPAPQRRKNEWAIGHTGVQDADIETHAGSDADLDDY